MNAPFELEIAVGGGIVWIRELVYILGEGCFTFSLCTTSVIWIPPIPTRVAICPVGGNIGTRLSHSPDQDEGLKFPKWPRWKDLYTHPILLY